MDVAISSIQRRRRADGVSSVPYVPIPILTPATPTIRNVLDATWHQIGPLIWYLPACVAMSIVLPELWSRLPAAQLQTLI